MFGGNSSIFKESVDYLNDRLMEVVFESTVVSCY
jgi:hypothetical protein